MKKRVTSILLCAALGLSLAACGSQSTAASSAAASGETKTGKADGFGGEVSATLTVTDGAITECVLEGADETPEVGGAALEELQAQVVAANGPEIDGVSGATVTSNAVRKAVSAALGLEVEEEPASSAAAPAPAAPAARVEIEGGLQIGQAYGAAHGTSCFTEAVAVVKDDVIIAAYVDDFQFMDASAGVTGVPNSDAGLKDGFAEGKLLCSKRVNAEYYSGVMAKNAGSTVPIDVNYDAIQSFVVGKTIAELEKLAGDTEGAVDAVSGATLADTAGYIGVIVDAAKNAQENQAVEFTGNSDDLKLSVIYGAAHGTKCFTSAAALTDGETIVLSYIDEFQIIGGSDVVGVPNSDDKFGSNVAEGSQLCSKRVNAEYYSGLMAKSAGATVMINANYDAIQNHINGMTIADASALAGQEDAVDAVSGATLADTANYIAAVVEAAQQ